MFDKKREQNGFTLVELAIALMVIGLLIGGVLKGQELIENARVTSTMRDFKSVDTAALIFRNTYNALPGDIKRPNRIPNCTTDICNIGGNGDGGYANGSSYTEILNFFPHMTKAGMFQGPEGGNQDDADSVNIYEGEGSKFFPIFATGFITGLDVHWETRKDIYAFQSVLKYARQMDAKMDDGLPGSGSVRVESCDVVENPDTGVNEYGTTDTQECYLWIEVGFK